MTYHVYLDGCFASSVVHNRQLALKIGFRHQWTGDLREISVEENGRERTIYLPETKEILRDMEGKYHITTRRGR